MEAGDAYRMNESLKEYCIRYDRRELLVQWHPDKNGDLTPEEIAGGSQRKVWWRFERGHEWMGQPYDRTKRGTGCPYCAGKRILPGMDLASVYPHLADQWKPQRNGELGSDAVLPGSRRSVWWECSKGHEWRAMIDSWVKGHGCLICAGKVALPGENDLETVSPVLAMQWHPDKMSLWSQVWCFPEAQNGSCGDVVMVTSGKRSSTPGQKPRNAAARFVREKHHASISSQKRENEVYLFRRYFYGKAC